MSEVKENSAGTKEVSNEPEGLPAEEFNQLLGSIGTVAPLVRSIFGGGECSPASKRRECLLLALKPYLSEGRCEAIDYLIRIGRIGDAIRALQ